MAKVVGVDAARAPHWVAVVLQDGRLASMRLHESLQQILDEHPDAAAIGVDVPLGHDDPDGGLRQGRRQCDVEGRAFLGPQRQSSLFGVPPLAILEAPTHELAIGSSRTRGWPAPSAQLWAIRSRILEAQRLLGERRLFEVHPETSFAMLADTLVVPRPTASKETWNGLVERLQLLHAARLRPERSLGGVGRASPDDVLDATIAAWSAQRIAQGTATPIPSPPPNDPHHGRPVAIWV